MSSRVAMPFWFFGSDAEHNAKGRSIAVARLPGF